MEYTFLTAQGVFDRGCLNLNTPYSEEKEKEAEFRFPREKTRLLAQGRPFTHAKIDTPIEVIQGDEKGRLKISLLEGSGEFSFHLYLGKPMEGDQWILALKTLRRDDKVVLSIEWD